MRTRDITNNALALLEECNFNKQFVFRYIRSERSIILINFCLSIVCSNILILVGQTQTHNAVSISILSLKCFT